MSASFIAPVVAIQEPSLQAVSAVAPGMLGGNTATSTSFGDMVSQGLNQVSDQLKTSQADLQSLAAGNVENLHQVMLRLEESRMSFQLMMQVRNRLLESYQELMRMQV
jgi:flagellar hook-basal body complex protein FliE